MRYAYETFPRYRLDSDEDWHSDPVPLRRFSKEIADDPQFQAAFQKIKAERAEFAIVKQITLDFIQEMNRET